MRAVYTRLLGIIYWIWSVCYLGMRVKLCVSGCLSYQMKRKHCKILESMLKEHMRAVYTRLLGIIYRIWSVYYLGMRVKLCVSGCLKLSNET